MNTFNLGFVFEDGPVIILVCASEKPLNTAQIQMVATKYFKMGIPMLKTIDKVIAFIIDKVREECGCQCVQVVADVAVSFPRNR